MQAHHRHMQELLSPHTVLAVDEALDWKMWGKVVLVMLVQVQGAVTQTRSETETVLSTQEKKACQGDSAWGGHDGAPWEPKGHEVNDRRNRTRPRESLSRIAKANLTMFVGGR